MKIRGNKGLILVPLESLNIPSRSWELTAEVSVLEATCQSEETEARSFISDGLKNASVDIDVVIDSDFDITKLEVGTIATLLLETDYSTIKAEAIIGSISKTVEVGSLIGFSVNAQIIDEMTEVFPTGNIRLLGASESGMVTTVEYAVREPIDYESGETFTLLKQAVNKITGEVIYDWMPIVEQYIYMEPLAEPYSAEIGDRYELVTANWILMTAVTRGEHIVAYSQELLVTYHMIADLLRV